MKLLQVTPYLHPRAGGPPVVVNRHSAALAERGWDITILTTDLHGADAHDEIVATVPAGVELELLTADRPSLLGLSSRAGSVLAQAIATADLVHIHTLWHPFFAPARRLCKHHGKPYLIMPHGMLDPYSLGVRRARKAVYLALLEKRNLRRAARTVYTTEEERELAEAAVKGLAPAAIVPLGSDAPHRRDPAPLRQDFLNRFPSARDRRRMLFLSRIHPKKGLDRLLDVLPRLIAGRPDLLFVIAGSGEDEHMSSMRRQIENLGLSDSVLLCGRLTGDLKWGAYAAAELFVLPSRQENFGLVVAEAMQMGLPVVISDRVNSRSHVDQAQAGVVCDCADPGTLYEALVGLLDDPSAAAEMGARGRSFAVAELTWEASTDRLESCYSEVLRDR